MPISILAFAITYHRHRHRCRIDWHVDILTRSAFGLIFVLHGSGYLI